MSQFPQKNLTYDQFAESIVEMGNRMLEADDSADVQEVASGILAGAVQFWLYSRQPCADPHCGACLEISSAQHRVAALLQETHELADESEYFYSSCDVMTGTA